MCATEGPERIGSSNPARDSASPQEALSPFRPSQWTTNSNRGGHLIRRALLLTIASVVVIGVAGSGSAEPAFEGSNGVIAFVTSPNDEADIYTVSPRGCDLHRVTTATGRDLYPSFSPDGNRIAYLRDLSSGAGGGWENWVVSADGSNPVRLTPPNEGDDGPAEWSPDGTRLAFRHEVDPHRTPTERSWEIYTIASDGSDLQRLTNNELWEDSPTYSPDGSRIAFTRREAGANEFNPAPEEIWVMDADGSDPVQITHNQDRDMDLQWAPVGDLVMFTRLVDGDSDLFVVDVSTGVETQLAALPLVERGAWRPDGSKIVYSEKNDIYDVNPDGTGTRKLGSNIGKYPKYSPDGTQILFSGADEVTVRVMDADGGHLRRVFGDRDTYLSGGPFIDWQPLGPQPPVTDVAPPVLTEVRDYPDPFSPATGGVTFIRFVTSEHATVTVSLHRNGRLVTKAQNAKYECAGFNEVLWRGKAGGRVVPDGTYTYKIKAEDAAGNIGRASGKVTVG